MFSSCSSSGRSSAFPNPDFHPKCHSIGVRPPTPPPPLAQKGSEVRERGGGVNALNACGSAPATGGSGPRGCGSDGDTREGGGMSRDGVKKDGLWKGQGMDGDEAQMGTRLGWV